MNRPHIGQFAPMPRPTARRLSDLNPYARLSAERDPDAIVGFGIKAVALALCVALGLGLIAL